MVFKVDVKATLALSTVNFMKGQKNVSDFMSLGLRTGKV